MNYCQLTISYNWNVLLMEDWLPHDASVAPRFVHGEAGGG